MKKLGGTLLILTAALICYAVGAMRPALVLLAAGVIFELWFWVRLFKRN